MKRRETSRRRLAPVRASRGCIAALLAGALASSCDRPFEPFGRNEHGPFSMVGYLDVGADTQWVRVMPVRQTVLAGPEPIDAVVTLSRLRDGRTVTLRDSLFQVADERLGGVAYGHVFWTTERLEPRARYRLTATRSDGAASTAVVETPAALDFTFLNLRDTAVVELRAERVLLAETYHALRLAGGEPGGVGSRRQGRAASGNPDVHVLYIDGSPVSVLGAVDARRMEFRLAAVRSDWPFPSTLPNPAARALPDTMPSNVENGLGFLGGVATRTIPFHRCAVLALRPGPQHPCLLTYNAQSASVAGRVIRQPCGRPHTLADVALTQSFPRGGSITLTWKTGWEGEYRFEGIEAGAALLVQVGPGVPAVRVPPLAPGQRYTVPDILVTQGC